MKYFAEGNQATVYDGFHPLFPHAKVQRKHADPNGQAFLELYYRHKFAEALFARYFIKVEGAQCDKPPRNSPVFQRLRSSFIAFFFGYQHTLFSRKATVDDQHHTFGTHMMPDRLSHSKKSCCACSDCSLHREVHESARELFVKTVWEVGQAGLFVPLNDDSDWCVVKNAQGEKEIIIFEVEKIDPKEATRYINSLKGTDPRRSLALGLLERYKYHLNHN